MTMTQREIELTENIAHAIGSARGWLSAIEESLKLLRDELSQDLLEGATVTTYSQRDPQWAGVKLGTGSTTIGGYGCLITSAASCLTDAGVAMNPEQLNEWLKANGGYAGGNRFVYAAVDKLNTVKFYNIIECANTPAPIDQLDQFVAEGWYVIVKVNNGKPPDYHWVRYLGKGQMADPWYGDIASITPRYIGKDAAQSIRAALIYKKA